MELIQYELKDSIGWITLNHDAKRNALSFTLLNQLLTALNDLEKQKARVVVIRANKGVKVWSSGFNIDELPRDGSDPLAYDNPLQKVIRAIIRIPAPVITMAEGSIWGGACNIAFVCDIVIGTKDTCLAITPAKIGVPYNTSGILQFLDIIGSHIAKEMFFTALPINAQQAKHHGVLNHLCPNVEELETFTLFTAEQMIQNSPLSIAVIKEQLRILGNSHPIMPETFERIQGLRRKVYDSKDYIEGKRAFQEKRSPVFVGE